MDRPIGDAGGYDEIGVFAAFQAVDVIIHDVEPANQLHQRDHLSAVRVAGKHEIDVRSGFGGIIAGLMIQHDGIHIRIDGGGKIINICAAAAEIQFLGCVLPADQLESIVDANAFILQYGYAVSGKFIDQIIAGVAAPPV